MQIIRPEPERSYLLHQARALRSVHDGPLEIVRDRMATDDYYDNERLRIHSGDLMRAYELLYPRDERQLTFEVLSITGQQGLAAMWCDCAGPERNGAVLRLRCSHEEVDIVQQWLDAMGITSAPWPTRPRRSGLRLDRMAISKALGLASPLLPSIMKSRWRDFR